MKIRSFNYVITRQKYSDIYDDFTADVYNNFAFYNANVSLQHCKTVGIFYDILKARPLRATRIIIYVPLLLCSSSYFAKNYHLNFFPCNIYISKRSANVLKIYMRNVFLIFMMYYNIYAFVTWVANLYIQILAKPPVSGNFFFLFDNGNFS